MATILRPLGLIVFALLALILLVLLQIGTLVSFFAENLAVNLMILGVFVFGIGLSFWRLYALAFEIDWLARIRSATQASNADSLAGPQVIRRLDLMAPFANLWRRFFDSNQALTPELASTLVESAQARVDERRELSRYLTTALVILGLLGTFWGLLGALVSMREALGQLDPGQGFFDGLSGSLTGPLENMGTAFSSSLFGLAASLFFGFVELQTARAQNRFVEDFEAWLVSFIQATNRQNNEPGSLTSKGAAFSPKAAGELGASFDSLAHLMRRGQQDTLVLNNNLVALLDQIARVADSLGADQAIHEKILATQADQTRLIEHLEGLGKSLEHLSKNLERTEPLTSHDPEGSETSKLSEDEEAPPQPPAAGAFLQSDKP